jgi:hypothetical protein
VEQYLTLLSSGLFEITCTRYNREIKEIKLVLAILIQACRDLHHKKSSDLDRKDALLYLYSDQFLYHCKLLALNDDVARQLLERKPRLGKNVKLYGNAA